MAFDPLELTSIGQGQYQGGKGMARGRLVLGDLSSQSQFCFCLKIFNDLLLLFLGCCFLH